MKTTQADRPMTTCDDNPAIVRPACCAECLRFFRDKDNPGKGWCEEFPAAGLLDETVVCQPNVGRKIRQVVTASGDLKKGQ